MLLRWRWACGYRCTNNTIVHAATKSRIPVCYRASRSDPEQSERQFSYGLNKRRVRARAPALGANLEVYNKVPTAELETLAPMKPDEPSFGISYDEIDDLLEGNDVSDGVYTTIYRLYDATHHKRALPITPYDYWRRHTPR
jgi:NH3-dependent NAD+ synthetase